MLITDITLRRVDLPLEQPLRTSIHRIDSVSCLLVTLTTDTGLEGEGHIFAFGIEKLRVLEAMVQAFVPMVLNRDPFMAEALWADMFQNSNFLGQAGISVMAMTPIDIACWDIVGKASGQNLHRVFGGSRDRIATYASGGMWLAASPADLVQEAQDFLKQGFKAMKVRLGKIPLAQNIERVEAVRDTIGPDIKLMADANQGLSVPEAIQLGRALEPYNLFWFEEPVPTWDRAGHAEIRTAIPMALASGETEYLRYGIRDMIEQKSADILMPDLQRMGGYTEFRRVIGQMAAASIPFSPHLFTEHSLSLVTSDCLFIEYMPWFAPLFREKVTINPDGTLDIPTRPGTGFTFDLDALEPYRV